MFTSEGKELTDFSRLFLEPTNPTHRQYEALRAFFVDRLPSTDAARRFGYTPGSFRVLVHQFRQSPGREFFLKPAKGPQSGPKTDPARERVIALRKENLSIYDISRNLAHEGHTLSPVAVGLILKEEGFARLPRRADDERPPGSRPTTAEVADVRQLDLSPQSFRTKFGGLFLFLPALASIPLDRILRESGFPGSELIPAGAAIRSLLALKLFGTARHGHVMSAVLDQGLALFAGLNVIPKRSFLTEYSCRIDPTCYPQMMRRWFDAVGRLGLTRGRSFDLDFHTIPFHGEDALIEKHYVSKRSRRQKGVLTFLAQDADTRVFCYANGDLRKNQQNDEVLQFVRFWKERTKEYPEELIFDSKLTTYANLNKLNKLGIRFVTLRRRSPGLLREIAGTPRSAWRGIELNGVSRKYTTPRILDQRITLSDYDGPVRQIIVADLGHEEPTVLLTNQLTRTAPKLVERYAQRMIIENSIADGIDFFHMDALSSAVAMKIDCDLQLTLMASSLYRLLAQRIGHGYERSESRHLFRDFVDATAEVKITKSDIEVRYQKRAHNPLLLAADFGATDVRIPWLSRKRLHLVFG
jgi:Transposase DDE domain